MNQTRLVGFLFLGILFICVSCEELRINPEEPGEEGTLVQGNATNVFENPAVGNFSYFVKFESDTEYDQAERLWTHSNITYVKDTLLIEVVEKNGDRFLVKESYTKGSETYLSAQDPNTPDFVEGSFWVSPTQEGWTIESANGSGELLSALFGFSTGIDLPRSKMGEFENISLFPAVFELDILGVPFYNVALSYNYGPMAYDGEGLQWYYTRDRKMVRIAFIGSWFPKGVGWDWVPG